MKLFGELLSFLWACVDYSVRIQLSCSHLSSGKELRCFPKCDKSTNVPHSPNIVFITISWFYIWVCFGFTYNVLDLCERLWWGDFGHGNVGEFHRILSSTTPLLIAQSELFFLFLVLEDTSMLTVCFRRLVLSLRGSALL